MFIDGGDCYYEFEINALGTIYEVLFLWQDAFQKCSRFGVPEFDVRSRNAVTFGGNYDRTPESFWRGTHPRGLRWAYLDWDFPGLRSAVRVDGKINDRSAIDRGWTVEMALPWAGMKRHQVCLVEIGPRLGGTVTNVLIHTLGGLYDSTGDLCNADLAQELTEKLTHADSRTRRRRIGRTWVLNTCPAVYESAVENWVAADPRITVLTRTGVVCLERTADRIAR